MARTIDTVISAILDNEGWPKVTKRAADKGGLTKGGIRFDLWQARTGGTLAEFLALSEQDARAYYFRYYVVEPGLEQVSEPLRTLLVDWYVTSWTDALKAVQRVLKARGLYAGKIDGVIGPKTSAALLRDRDPNSTYDEVLKARIDFYLSLALVKDPDVREFLRTHPKSQLHNLHGWTNRCLEFVEPLPTPSFINGDPGHR